MHEHVCYCCSLYNIFFILAYRCGKILSGLYGKFHSPGFPVNYYDFLQCSWTITVDKGFYINLRFTVFDIEYYPNCSYDYLRVTEQGKVLGTYCGSTSERHSEAISQLKSSGNNIRVEFYSDYSNEKKFKGFEAHYRAIGMLDMDAYTSILHLACVRNSCVHTAGAMMSTCS